MRFLRPWNFPGKSTGVGCHFLLQGIFPTQGLNPGLQHCRQTILPSEPPWKQHRGNIFNILWQPIMGKNQKPNIHVKESLCCTPEINTTLLINSLSICQIKINGKDKRRHSPCPSPRDLNYHHWVLPTAPRITPASLAHLATAVAADPYLDGLHRVILVQFVNVVGYAGVERGGRDGVDDGGVVGLLLVPLAVGVDEQREKAA